MTSPTSAPGASDEGYWTIQIINQDRGQVGGRFLCQALNDRQAQSIALRLAGSGRTVVGYDYHRIDKPPGSTVAMGQSQTIDNLDAWAALRAPPVR